MFKLEDLFKVHLPVFREFNAIDRTGQFNEIESDASYRVRVAEAALECGCERCRDNYGDLVKHLELCKSYLKEGLE